MKILLIETESDYCHDVCRVASIRSRSVLRAVLRQWPAGMLTWADQGTRQKMIIMNDDTKTNSKYGAKLALC
jgi:hypothetical protein